MYLKTKWKVVFLFCLFFILGHTLSFNAFYKKDYIVNNLVENKKEVLIYGQVVELSLTSTNKQKIKFKVEKLKYKEDNEEVIYKKNFNISAVLKEGDDSKLGQYLLLKGELLEPDKVRNPGGFDEYLFLKNRNIDYKSFPQVLDYSNVETDFFMYLNTLRTKVSDIYKKTLPEREAGIISSMVLGDKSDLDKEIKELYIANGIYHIISISGLHISALSLVIFFILNRFLSKKITSTILIVFLVLYCLFTGNSPSTVRAVIMSSTVLFSYIIFRDKELLTSIAFACLSILIYSPVRLFDIGFQLSFLAVLGMGIGLVPIERVFVYIENKIDIRQAKIMSGNSIFKKVSIIKILGTFIKKILKIKFIREGLSVFIAVSIFTYPISCVYFYYTYPYSLFVNILIVPTAIILVFVGILVPIIGVFSLPIATFLSGILYFVLKFYEYIGLFFSRLPYSKVLIGHINILTVCLYFILVGIIIKMLYSFGTDFKLYKKILIYYICFLTSISFVVSFIPKKLTVTMLDVGQGDCIVINEKNSFFIIDGGGMRNKEIGNNTGIYNLLPYLDYSNAKVIDGIFVTHTDADHILGIIEIIGKKEIKNIFLPKVDYTNDELFNNLEVVAKKNNIEVHFISSYDIINIREDFGFLCIYPFSETETDKNNSSLVLKLKYKEIKFLFTGDIEEPAEKNILEKNIDISADILKVAHHGSKTSSTLPFLREVMPVVSIAGVGANNSFGHPNEEVVQRILDLGSKFYTTAKDGAIIIQSDGKKIFLKKMINKE